jgi:Arc/MetJ family transcription regulator
LPVNVYDWLLGYTSIRTNIVIDDKLMRDTLRATGLKTKREVVGQALRTLLHLRRQAEIRRFRGKLDWQGDLNAMTSDHWSIPAVDRLLQRSHHGGDRPAGEMECAIRRLGRESG